MPRGRPRASPRRDARRGRAPAGHTRTGFAPNGRRGPSRSSGPPRSPPDPGRRGRTTLDGFQVLHAGAGRGVASVGDAVDDELLRAQPCRQLDHGAHVLELRVHATVGAQPQKVHPWSCGQRGAQHVVVGERIARYRVVDPGDRLRHHCSGSQREVAHLRVAHLPIGQPDARPGGAQRAAGAVRPQLVEHGRACQRDRVARTGRGDPPAVQHDQAHAGC